MDFNKLDTKADAEAGSRLHYVHPQLRHKLYSGEGSDDYGRLVDPDKPHEIVGALVRGMESKRVQDFLGKSSASELLRADPKAEEAYDFAIELIIELYGVKVDGKKLGANAKDLNWFFGRSEDFATQTINHARNRANFFKAASPE